MDLDALNSKDVQVIIERADGNGEINHTPYNLVTAIEVLYAELTDLFGVEASEKLVRDRLNIAYPVAA